jgi:prenyltransferase beta subunit
MPAVLRTNLTKYLKNLHNNETGGFRGAKSLQSHVASTYGAIMAIVNIGTEEAYEIVKPHRELMRIFLKSVFTIEPQKHDPSLKASEINVGEKGAYILHENGEYDLRGCY